jgi:hypothetical protein
MAPAIMVGASNFKRRVAFFMIFILNVIGKNYWSGD